MEFKVGISVSENGKRSPKLDLVDASGGDLDGKLSLEELFAYVKKVLIVTADTVLKDAQAQGFDKNPVVTVDGVTGKPIVDVKPIGSIEFTARADMGDIVLATYQALLDRSPVKTGRFKSSNYVFHNGIQVATDLSSLESWLANSPNFQERDLIRFVNIQPYARKLERHGTRADGEGGTQSKKRYSTRKNRPAYKVLVPNGTYYVTARAIRNKYKRNSIIKFEFIQGSQLGLTASFGPRRGKPGRPYLYPSILISVQESGTL